jgi:hypothetical protein
MPAGLLASHLLCTIYKKMATQRALLQLIAVLLAITKIFAWNTPVSIKYSTVSGYFLQDLNSTNTTGFDYVRSSSEAEARANPEQTAVNFGLINQTYPDVEDDCAGLTQWQRFAKELKRLNHNAAKGTAYKLLFLGRHGEGWHNAAEVCTLVPAWTTIETVMLNFHCRLTIPHQGGTVTGH